MNWKSLVETSLASENVLPEGWDSRETVAAQLQCSEDRVRVLLGSAIKTRQVEMKVFPVWDKLTKRVMRVTAYRKLPAK